MKKIRKFLSFNNPIASRPIISLKVVFVPALGGGVFGKVKLKRPIIKETQAARRKVFARVFFCSQASQAMMRPAMIQPTVPHTLIFAKSFSGLSICLNETALTRASVGINKIIYTSKAG